MKKKSRLAVFILLLLGLSSYSLLATNTGLGITIKLISLFLPGELRIAHSDGSLWQQFSLEQLVYQTPNYQIRIQRLQANWQLGKLLSGRLPIQKLRLNKLQFYEFTKIHKPNLILAIEQVNLNGQLGVLAKQPLRLQLTWQTAQFWLSHKQQINNGHGQLLIQGSRTHYQWQLYSQLPGINLPSSTWQLTGQGSTTDLNLNPSTIQLLDGHINAQGFLSWQQPLHWQLKLQAQQLNPAKLSPNIPGKLNFSLTSQGSHNQQLEQSIELNQLSGNLHNKPLTGHASIKMIDSNLYLNSFELAAGNAVVNIAGHITHRWDLRWHINIPNLDKLVTNGYGSLYTEGSIGGLRRQPIINTVLSVQQLKLGEHSVKSISARGEISLDHSQDSKFKLIAKQLQLNTVNIQQAQIDLTGHVAQQKLLATVITPTEHYSLQATSQHNHQQWQIQIPQFSMHSQRFNNWQLSTPIAINLAGKKGSIQPFCWQTSQQQACFNNIAWQGKDQWQATIQGQHLDLKILNFWLPQTARLNGHADIQLNTANQLGHIQAQTKLNIGVARLSYTPAHQATKNILVHDVTASGQLTPKGLQADIQAIVFDQPLVAAIELPEYQIGLPEPKQALRGQISFNMDDIAILSAVIPNTADISGLLQLKLKVAGTIAQPELDGKVVLKQGGFTLPVYNARVEQIQGVITGQSNGKISYELTGQAGPGSYLKLTGNANLFAQPLQSTTRLIGTHATIVNTDQYQIIANPDVQLLTQGKQLQLSGQIYIPEASLQPTDFSPGVVELPEDIVIIGGKQTDPTAAIPFSMQLKINLGKKVNIDAKGLSGQIEGHTELYLQPQHPLTATGQLNILEGNYNIYGENLSIRTGRLIYAGGPIDNPGLNIQAVRLIKTSLLDQITVGVNVQGRLKQPNVNLFSEPANLSQADILAYLLTGAPVSQVSEAKGQLLFKAATMLNPTGDKNIANLKKELQTNLGLDELDVGTLQQYSTEKGSMVQNTSLMLGKQLTPKLHLGYSVGITEHINTFSLRYLLWRKLILQTQTTGQNSGIDLIYTIEH